MPVSIVLIHQITAALVIHLILGIYTIPTLIYKRILSNSWAWVDLVVYFVILAAVIVADYQHKNKMNELKLSRLQSRLVQSHLNALKSQLHPHFLFNTLNTLSTLILKGNNDEAERMLDLLNNFLRSTIYVSEENEISFREELNFINHYLEIEKVRFNDKLTVTENIGEEVLDAVVPSFLLQPLIENAVHYAIAPKKSNGIIRLTVKRELEKLSIYIEDNGPGLKNFGKSNSQKGVGLKITKERLQHLYGKGHLFELKNSSLGGLMVIIKIPYRNRFDSINVENEFMKQPVDPAVENVH